MSNEIYPALPGLAFDVRVSPAWSTDVRTTPSGREYRSGQQIYPRYKRRLQYEFLRAAPALQEMQTLRGFFNRHAGRRETFLLDDPDDDSCTTQLLGIGDGSTVAFQALRTLGGYIEPVYAINAVQSLTVNDWQGTASSLQPYSRTNLAPNSESLNTTGTWTRGQLTAVTADATSAPDGTTSAEKLIPNTSAGAHNVNTSIVPPVQSASYVNSVYLKKGEYTQAYLAVNGSGTTGYTNALFDLNAGTVISGPGGISSVGNGWYRCWLNWTSSSTAASATLAVGAASGGAVSMTGDGTSGIYAWGFQAELCGQVGASSSPPSRYIKTTAAAASATDYTLSNGLFTLATAPAAGAEVRWSGTYYWRCRFDTDQLDLDKFLDKLWKAGQVDLMTVKT